MKRVNNLYQKIYSIKNLILADKKARKGKTDQYGVKVFDNNPADKLLQLHEMLKNKTYQTSVYKTFQVYEPKERTVFCLPYFPDRIAHHAVMNILDKYFNQVFTADSYSCIKGKGIHGFDRSLKKALQDVPGTQYCLKLDIKKFYPNINHSVLKALIRRKFKDADLLWLLDGIIDSAPGVPIGNYLSQYFANYYLTGFDHWLKEKLQVKYYFRYADDIVILAADKNNLHELLSKIKEYLQENLKLEVKGNYQVFPVAARGIDVVGYVYYHGYTRLRKSIKKRFARKVYKNINHASVASYKGWTKHADCRHLVKKILHGKKI